MRFIKTAWSMIDKPIKKLSLSGLIVIIGFPLGFINEWIPVICLCVSVCNMFYVMWTDILKEEWEEFKLKVREKMNEEDI